MAQLLQPLFPANMCGTISDFPLACYRGHWDFYPFRADIVESHPELPVQPTEFFDLLVACSLAVLSALLLVSRIAGPFRSAFSLCTEPERAFAMGLFPFRSLV